MEITIISIYVIIRQLQIAEMMENKAKGEDKKTEIIKLYPKSCSSLEEMLGRLDSDGNWMDGVLTRILR